MVQYLR